MVTNERVDVTLFIVHRTSDGLTHELWRESDVGFKCSLWDLVNCTDFCEDFIASGVLLLNRDGLRLSSDGLKLADHVIPYLLANLIEKLNK